MTLVKNKKERGEGDVIVGREKGWLLSGDRQGGR